MMILCRPIAVAPRPKGGWSNGVSFSLRFLVRNRIARSGQDPIGRVSADREAGADYAGHAESCGCSNKKVTD